MSTVTNILVNDKFWKLPTPIIFLDRQTRDKDIYPKPAHIYLFIFLSHWYWIYSFLSLILNIVWVCMIPYMCITNVNVFWQICYYFQNLFQFMCNRKGHLQGKRYKMLWWWLVFNDDSSSGNYSLTLIFFSLFSSPIFWRKIALPWKKFCDYVICQTISNLLECSYCLSLFFNIPVFFLPWFHSIAYSFYLTSPHIFLSKYQVLYTLGLFSTQE